MSLSLKPSADGLSAILQVSGVDVLKMGAGAVGDPLEVAKKTDIATVFTKEYTSAEQAITAGGLLTLAHGLGVVPKLVVGQLICKTAENGYAIGDVIEMPLTNLNSTAANGYGCNARKDTTNVYIRYGSNASLWPAVNGTTGVYATLSAANWRLVVRAFA